MTEIEKVAELEHSVLFDSPRELDRTCRRLGNIKYSSRALGLACKFRGLEWAKALVKNNVVFRYSDMREFVIKAYVTPDKKLYFSLLDDFMFPLVRPDIRLRGMAYPQKSIRDSILVLDKGGHAASDKEFTAVSEEERLKCAEYFIGLNDKEICDLQKLLYLAITSCDLKLAGLLREKGVTLSQSACDMLTGEKEQDHYFFWNFCHKIRYMTAEEFIWAVRELSKDLGQGKTVNISTWFLDSSRKYFYEPKAFECILEHFNQKKLNKKKTMEEIILLDKTELLPVCEKHGWLKMPKKRDELIRFASDNKKTECTAWLLEFKNRTADLNAERERAEKKLMRELNANPDSITELKKVWGFERREDGAVIITRYKGKLREIEVPERIGGGTVKEIGETAFSPDALRIKSEHREFLTTVTKITLPQTVEAIGDRAFYMCKGLTEINIPDNVKKIGSNAFCYCENLVSIDIPAGVGEIGKGVFAGCKSLVSVTLPYGIAEIESHSFSGCACLRNIVIPPTVKKIGKWTFNRCVSLEEVIIPEGVEEIEMYAFWECTGLKSAVLPLSLKKIKNYTQSGKTPQTAFHNAKNLTASVTEKSYAEKYCKRNNIPYKACKEV